LLHGREFTVRLFGKHYRRTLGTIASGLLLAAMGALTVVIAFTGPGMGNSGWRVRVAADLQHWAALTTRGLSWLPGWVFAAVLAAAVVLIIRQLHRRPSAAGGHAPVAQTVNPDVGADEPPRPDRATLEPVPGSER
jgi:amino acid transporter